MRRRRQGFVMAWVLFVLGVVLALAQARGDRMVSAAQLVRRQAMRAQALAVAEGAIEESRYRLESGGNAAVELDLGDRRATCETVRASGPGRVALLARGVAGTGQWGVQVRVELRVEAGTSGPRTVVESWSEQPLP